MPYLVGLFLQCDVKKYLGILLDEQALMKRFVFLATAFVGGQGSHQITSLTQGDSEGIARLLLT